MWLPSLIGVHERQLRSGASSKADPSLESFQNHFCLDICSFISANWQALVTATILATCADFMPRRGGDLNKSRWVLSAHPAGQRSRSALKQHSSAHNSQTRISKGASRRSDKNQGKSPNKFIAVRSFSLLWEKNGKF